MGKKKKQPYFKDQEDLLTKGLKALIWAGIFWPCWFRS